MMALTSRWLTVGEAAQRLRRSEQEVLRLAISQTIHSRLADGNHWELCTAAVEEYADEAASECAARKGEVVADSADGPSVRGGPEIGDEAERDYERSKNDYDDTPTDEGDDQQ